MEVKLYQLTVKSMLISIVIPVFNVSNNLLKRSIESIIMQSDSSVEIIIVDDGSEDVNTASYKNLCEEYIGIKYFRKENFGPSAARNYGVEKAQGEYILFVDADDYITDKCIEQAKNVINKYHPDIVFGYVYKDLFDEGVIRYKLSDNTSEELIINDKNDLASLLNHILGYEDQRFTLKRGYLSDGPWCRFFRRSLFTKNHFDVVPKWNEDTLWNIGLLKDCHTVVVCKTIWYIYAVRKGSTMQGYRNNCYEEFIYITAKVSTIGKSIWNRSIDKGVAYRVWHDLFILSRAFIFNSKNTNSFSVKYTTLKNAIKSEPYEKAIRTVDFHFEKRKSRHMVKELLNLAMKIHCYYIAYFMIKFYIRRA